MRSIKKARITGTGLSVPPRVVTNDDLAKIMETSNEWILQRTGIRERRHVDPGTTPTDLAEIACRKALDAAHVRVEDIDLLLVATLSPQHYFPGTCAFLQDRLRMGTTPSLDLRAQCSGFVYGLNVARAMIESGTYKKILLCGVEIQSRALDMSSEGRETAVLFGDGAGAVVIEAGENPEFGIMNVVLHSEGAYADKLWVEAPSNVESKAIDYAMLDRRAHIPKMEGKVVFKNAVVRLPQVVMETLAPFHLSPKDIDMFVFHQANLRINEHVAGSLGISAERCFNNIDRFGNCSAASIPICLDEAVRGGRIKDGSLVCVAAFGSGFTWGGALIRW